MKFVILTGAALILAGGLSACGRMGELEPPGTPTQKSPRGAWADNLVDPATVNRPSSQVPIDGGPSDLIGGTAAGREPQ